MRLPIAIITATILAAALTPGPGVFAQAPPSRPSPPAPPGMLDAKAADALEAALDGFIAAADAGKRQSIYDEQLTKQGVGLTLAELNAIASPPDLRPGPRGVVRVRCPWSTDEARGWFNLAVPNGYTPKKAWPLVVVLHGAEGGADGLVPLYTPALNQAGCFVVYPNTSDSKQYWSANQQIAVVYRVIDWVVRRYRIDFRRLMVTGVSMGGVGTWTHALLLPELWSAAAAVAGHPGDMAGNAVERLRGVNIYMLHGAEDKSVSVDWARKSSAALDKRRVEHVYVEAPGAGHVPPLSYWGPLNRWLVAQPAKSWSPRPAFLPTGDQRTLWQATADPLGLDEPPQQQVMALLHDGKSDEAYTLARRLAGQSRGDARLAALLAVAALPAILDPLPDNMRPQNFDAEQWNRPAEDKALASMQLALRLKDGKAPAQAMFDAEVHLLLAKLWAKRFAVVVDTRSRTLVTYYNRYVTHIDLLSQLHPGHQGVYDLAKKVNPRIPQGRIQLR